MKLRTRFEMWLHRRQWRFPLLWLWVKFAPRRKPAGPQNARIVISDDYFQD